LRMTTVWNAMCMQSSDTSAKSFMWPANSISHKGGEKNLSIIKETLWKNNLNFVKDVPMIYVNFIEIVFIIAEEKMGGLLSYYLSYVLVLSEGGSLITLYICELPQ
jgi:hypothetical protein